MSDEPNNDLLDRLLASAADDLTLAEQASDQFQERTGVRIAPHLLLDVWDGRMSRAHFIDVVRAELECVIVESNQGSALRLVEVIASAKGQWPA